MAKGEIDQLVYQSLLIGAAAYVGYTLGRARMASQCAEMFDQLTTRNPDPIDVVKTVPVIFRSGRRQGRFLGRRGRRQAPVSIPRFQWLGTGGRTR